MKNISAMTYNERVRAIAEEMAKDAISYLFSDVGHSLTVDEIWNKYTTDEQEGFVINHIRVARIAVKHMAGEYEQGWNDHDPDNDPDWTPDIEKYLLEHGLIPEQDKNS